MVAKEIDKAIIDGSNFLVCRHPQTGETQIFTRDERYEDAVMTDAAGVKTKFKQSTWLGLKPSIKQLSDDPPLILSQQSYLSICEQMVSSIKNKRLEKVILSRIKKTSLKQGQLGELFDLLCGLYPNTLTYLYYNAGHTWIGATPELLASFEGNRVKCASLAGTISIDGGQWTKKEFREQEIVTDFISKCINSHGHVSKVHGPEDLHAGEVKHLQTLLEGEVNDKQAFLKDLHPTPAIAGFPVDVALTTIAKLEPHKRGFYTGYVQFNIENNSSAYVNLRCLQHINNNAYLYLGGGITADSDARNEWQETELKARTLLSAIEKL